MTAPALTLFHSYQFLLVCGVAVGWDGDNTFWIHETNEGRELATACLPPALGVGEQGELLFANALLGAVSEEMEEQELNEAIRDCVIEFCRDYEKQFGSALTDGR